MILKPNQFILKLNQVIILKKQKNSCLGRRKDENLKWNDTSHTQKKQGRRMDPIVDDE